MALLVVVDTPSFVTARSYIGSIPCCSFSRFSQVISMMRSQMCPSRAGLIFRCIGSKTRSTALLCTSQAFVWRRVRQPRMEKATCPPRDDMIIFFSTRSFSFVAVKLYISHLQHGSLFRNIVNDPSVALHVLYRAGRGCEYTGTTS